MAKKRMVESRVQGNRGVLLQRLEALTTFEGKKRVLLADRRVMVTTIHHDTERMSIGFARKFDKNETEAVGKLHELVKAFT